MIEVVMPIKKEIRWMKKNDRELIKREGKMMIIRIKWVISIVIGTTRENKSSLLQMRMVVIAIETRMIQERLSSNRDWAREQVYLKQRRFFSL